MYNIVKYWNTYYATGQRAVKLDKKQQARERETGGRSKQKYEKHKFAGNCVKGEGWCPLNLLLSDAVPENLAENLIIRYFYKRRRHLKSLQRHAATAISADQHSTVKIQRK